MKRYELHERILLNEIPSTHNYVKEHFREVDALTPLYALEQTAGRGQRGNHWEAEPGKNLTFSFHFAPQNILPREQFAISEAIALAISDTMRDYDLPAMVKWPNDIYVNDRKICGILIDHAISCTGIERTTVSAGLNVNQTRFLSDAPNPTSMAMEKRLPSRFQNENTMEKRLPSRFQNENTMEKRLPSRFYTEFPLWQVATRMEQNISRRLDFIDSPEDRSLLHADFMHRLWRGDGRLYPFLISETGETRMARIDSVLPTGHIILRFADGSTEAFPFKAISFLPT